MKTISFAAFCGLALLLTMPVVAGPYGNLKPTSRTGNLRDRLNRAPAVKKVAPESTPVPARAASPSNTAEIKRLEAQRTAKQNELDRVAGDSAKVRALNQEIREIDRKLQGLR